MTTARIIGFQAISAAAPALHYLPRRCPKGHTKQPPTAQECRGCGACRFAASPATVAALQRARRHSHQQPSLYPLTPGGASSAVQQT